MAMLATPLLTSMGVSAATASTMGTIFSGLSLVGDFMSSRSQAKAQEKQGIYENKVAIQNAGQIEAQSQREMLVAKRKGDLVASSAKAQLASGGGASSDPTAVNLVADIEARGAENALNELYSGTSRADAVRQGGQMAAYQGRMDAASTRAAGMSSLIGGASTLIGKSGSLMDKYGGGGAGKVTSSSYYPNSKTWVDWYG